MNWTIILNTLREQFSSNRVLFVFVGFTMVYVMFDLISQRPTLPDTDELDFFAWILGTGIIGTQLRSGVLQLVFVRPVTRSEYIWSKYFALSSIIFSFSLLLWIATCVVSLFIKSELTFQNAFTNLADHLIFAFGITAIIVLLSTLRKGHGDILVALFLYLMVPVLRQTGQYFHVPAVVRASAELERFLSPAFSVSMFDSGIWWFAIVSYFSTITFCLALAIIVLNRKELSYAE